ncbi:MAG: acetylxylan esterase [Phycisphaeraceae bacterium]|nr:acetylxylan esterase [Phycisphaeraceae bacterium]
MTPIPTDDKVNLSRDLSQWRRRRTYLRRLVRDLMMSDAPAPRTPARFKVVAEGRRAVDQLNQTRADHMRTFPNYFNWSNDPDAACEKAGDWSTRIVEYAGWPGEPAQRAVLRIPHRLREPAPAVLCFHGHTVGCLMGKETVNDYAIPLTKRGFITLSPDACRFGDRRDRSLEEAEIKDFKGMSFFSERLLALPLMLEGRTLLGVMTWEHQRAIDALSAWPGVDPHRIGCIGASMGGLQSFYLAALEDRIACVVSIIAGHSHRVWARERTLNALIAFIPHILKHTDAGEIGSLIAPRPIMCLDGKQDGYFPSEGIRQTSRVMRHVYKLYGASRNYQHPLHDGGHKMTDEHLEMAVQWMARWLRPTPAEAE